MNRVFTKGFILLAVFLVVLAGLSAAMLLLTPEEGRTGNFWISFWTIIFAVVLAFVYMLFHIFAGRGGNGPSSPAARNIGYAGAVLRFRPRKRGRLPLLSRPLQERLPGHPYPRVPGAGGRRGALTILSLSTKEADTTASLKRSRLFVLTTRIGSLAGELNLCSHREMASGIIGGLNDLKEAIRFSDPMSAGGEDGEEKVVLAVAALENKCRRFMALSSGDEREKAVLEIENLIDRAFSALKTRNEDVLHGK